MAALKFLTSEQKQFWEENGYIKLSNVYSSKEINEISDAYNELFERKHRENLEGLESACVGEEMKAAGYIDYTVKSIHNLQMHSAVFTRAITHPNLLDALEDIMDTTDILLHYTKAAIKSPEKGTSCLVHQDYHYFPHKKHTMLALFLHLDDVTPECGCLAVYPGSHKLGPLTDYGVTEKDEQYHYVNPEEYPLSKTVPVSAKRGEIVIFSYLLLHGSYSNLSSRSCRMFVMKMRAADDEPIEDVHKSPCQSMVVRGKNIREATMTNKFLH